MITQEQIDALSEGAEADALVSRYIGWRVSHPTADIESMMRVEGEVKRLGLSEAYAVALKHIVQEEDPEGLPKDFLMAHATALQRAKAFLTLHVG